jgi:hypothetical protein
MGEFIEHRLLQKSVEASREGINPIKAIPEELKALHNTVSDDIVCISCFHCRPFGTVYPGERVSKEIVTHLINTVPDGAAWLSRHATDRAFAEAHFTLLRTVRKMNVGDSPAIVEQLRHHVTTLHTLTKGNRQLAERYLQSTRWYTQQSNPEAYRTTLYLMDQTFGTTPAPNAEPTESIDRKKLA